MANMFKEVNYNNGEGLEFTDLNAMQRYASAFLMDGIQMARINGHLSTARCYVGGPLSCYPISSATLLRSEHVAGMVYQLPAAAAVDGDAPALLSYYMEDNEFQTDHAAQHATLERYDVVCLTLAAAVGDSVSRDFKDSATDALTTTVTNKEQRVTCVRTVVQGATAAVGSAVEPAVTAGSVKWYVVRIRPVSEGSGALDDTLYRDYTFPLSLGTDVVNPARLEAGAVTFATEAPFRRTATAASQVVYAVPSLPENSRLMSISLTGEFAVGATVELVRITPTSGGFSLNVLQDISAIAAVGAGYGTRAVDLSTVAWWDNSEQNRTAGSTTILLAVRITSGASGDTVATSRFVYAVS